jgi:phosphoribosylformylglycinamidine cyclo-ligase
MVVDDIVVVGAKSMFMTDYIATGKVVPSRIADIVSGIAKACKEVGVSLIGGETAEHPGLLKPNEYDVAGAAVGAVEYSKLLGPHKVQVGDVVLGLESSGLHSNGYSLVRKIIADSKLDYNKTVQEFGNLSLGEALLEPTRLYTGILNNLLESDLGSAVKAMSHITGGGIGANLARVLPKNTTLDVDRGSWKPLDVFQVLTSWGNLTLEQVESTWNLGLGFAVIVKADQATRIQVALTQAGVNTWQLGIVESNDCSLEGYIQGAKGVDGGAVRLKGKYLA